MSSFMWRRYTGSAAAESGALCRDAACTFAGPGPWETVRRMARECSFSSGDLPKPSLHDHTCTVTARHGPCQTWRLVACQVLSGEQVTRLKLVYHKGRRPSTAASGIGYPKHSSSA